MKYRPEIDGLRALAVLPVIFYHAGASLFQGGFVGVDVFFVISGFLITSIIAEDIAEKRFSLKYFYERRARRILPALFFVMACCLPFAWLWMTSMQLKDFAQSLVSVSFFSSNIFFYLKSGYFEAAAELKPLIHTWSLAVEEQYYIVFPFILMGLYKFRHSAVYIGIILLCIMSLICAEILRHHDDAANFFLLPSRMWELGIGALLAIYIKDKQTQPIYPQILSLLGLGCIALSIVIFNEATPHPSLITAIPVLGAALIIYAAVPGTIAHKILSCKYIVFIGLLSYSAYLWHQPLFAFARIKWGADLHAEIYTALIMAALFLSWVSWKFIEGPFRNKNKTSLKQIIGFSCLGSLLFIAAGLAGHVKQGFPDRYGEKAHLILAEQEKPIKSMFHCLKNSLSEDLKVFVDRCSLGATQKNTQIILWGDSHAAALGYGFDKQLKEKNYSGVQMTANGCPASPELTRLDNPNMYGYCAEHSKKSLERIEHLQPRYVIVSQRWTLQSEGTRFNNAQGGIESGGAALLGFVENDDPIKGAELATYYIGYYNNLAKLLAERGTKLVLITQVPEAGWHVPDQIFMNLRDKKTGELTTLRSVYDARNQIIAPVFDALKSHENIIIIDASEAFCDEKYCRNTEDQIPLYLDDDHLSMRGSVKLVEFILNQLTLE